jgi:hypothetical protein
MIVYHNTKYNHHLFKIALREKDKIVLVCLIIHQMENRYKYKIAIKYINSDNILALNFCIIILIRLCYTFN